MKKILCALIAILLTGCTQLTSGVVIEKNYRKAHTTVVPVFTGKVMMAVPQRHPERWSIVIKAEVDGKEITQSVRVTEEEFNGIKIGDEWGTKDE